MTIAKKRRRRKATAKQLLRPDVGRPRKTTEVAALRSRLLDAALAIGAALGLLVALFTGSIAPGAVSHRGPLHFPLP